MGPQKHATRGRGRGRGKKRKQDFEEHQPANVSCTKSDCEEEEEMEEEEADESTGKCKKERHDFDAATEQKLVEFFSANDCFFNKGSERYANTAYKTRILNRFATELNSNGEYELLTVMLYFHMAYIRS